MKRILLVSLAVFLLAALAACGNPGANDPTNKDPETNAETTTNTSADIIRTEAPPETTTPPSSNLKDPSFYSPDLSKYADYKLFKAPEGNPRDIVYDHMYYMSQIEWVASKSWTTHFDGKPNGGLQLKYEEGKTYYGIPYAETACSAPVFLDYVIDGKFYPNTDVYETLVGNHCSASMGHAFQQIIDLQYEGGLLFTEKRKGYIKTANGLKVPYNDDGTIASYDSQAIFDLNGIQAIYDAYATLEKGDILYKMVAPSGHTRMVSKVEVARNTAGKLLPSRSYVYCIEQTSAWADTKFNSTWFIDRKYAFETLVSTLFTPFTLEIYHTENPVIHDAYIMVTHKNDAESLKKMLKGSIESTFPLNYVRATIEDENGNIVSEVLKYKLIKHYKITLRDMTFSLGADKLPAGTYTFKLKAAIARGSWEIENFQFTVE